jgi:hypothetical protein
MTPSARLDDMYAAAQWLERCKEDFERGRITLQQYDEADRSFRTVLTMWYQDVQRVSLSIPMHVG